MAEQKRGENLLYFSIITLESSEGGEEVRAKKNSIENFSNFQVKRKPCINSSVCREEVLRMNFVFLFRSNF